MIKRSLTYGIIVGITLCLFYLFPEKIVGLALTMECVYFVVAFLYVQLIAGKLEISMNNQDSSAEKNSEIPIFIDVKNKSRIFHIPFQVEIRVTNYFTGEEKISKLNSSVKHGKIEKLQTTFVSKSCGDIDVCCVRYRVYDWLYIFRRKKKINITKKVEILPECHLIMTEVTRATREFNADSELYSDSEKGDDLSEIYQIREYEEGDSIHDIHWKLSAKNDELLIKEHGKPLGCVVLIWIDLWNNHVNDKGKERKKRKKQKSKMPITAIEMASSISLSLVEEECVHMVAWYEQKNDRIIKKRVSDEENIYELLNRLLYIETYSDREKADIQFQETFHKRDFSSVVEVHLDGKVTVNGHKVEIKKKGDEICFDETLLIV